MNRSLLLFILLGCAVDCHVAAAQAPPTCSALSWSSPLVRAEGVTELVSDIYMVCTGGTPVSAGAAIPAFNMTLSFNAKVTSRIIGTDGQSSEALLLLDEPAAAAPPAPAAQFPCESPIGVCPSFGNGNGNLIGTSYYGGGPAGPGNNRNVFQGLVGTANALVWKAIPFDPPGLNQVRIYRFTNVRLDATSLTGGPGDLKAISISMTGPTGAISVTSNSPDGSLVVATSQASLIATVRDAASAGTSTGETVPVSAAASLVRMATLRFAGAFAGADKARTAAPYVDADTSPLPVIQNVAGASSGTETGFYNSSFGSFGARGNLGTAGLANSGTRYMAVINNIPDGFNVYVDVNNSTGIAGPTARLINTDASGAGTFAAAPGTDGKAQLTVIGGKAVAVWEVLRTQAVATDQFDFGVYLSYPASSAATPPGPTDIQMMYAPTGGHAAPPTKAIPVFDGTATSQNLFTYTLATGSTPDPSPNGAPAITVSPTSMNFKATVGGQNPAPQFLQVSSSNQPLGFSITSGGTIPLQPLPSDGVTYKLVTISVDPKGMTDGTYQDTLTVTNTVDGTTTPVAVTFTINPAPQITTLSVPSVQAGSPGFTLTVNGTNFSDGCLVRWNGKGLATTFTSTAVLMVQVPASLLAATGSAAITVNTPDGAVSQPVSLAIETLAISSLSPAAAFAGDAGFTLTIAGSGFPAGTTVTFAGTVLKATAVTSTQITADVPASLVAKEGTTAVSVTSPGGSVSNPIAFTVAPVFMTTKLSPSVVMVGGSSFTLEISGAGFIGGTTVQVGGVQLRPISLAANKIVVTVQAAMIAQAGSVPVSVLRPDLPPSNSLTLTVSALPAITALDPPSVNAKSPSFNLTVAGVGFLPGSTVRWNAQALPTTLVSSTQLTAAVPAALVGWLGTALIDVSVGGNAFSSAVMIRITAPGPPTLTAVSPATITVGSAPVSITLTGTGFTPGCSVVFTPPAADPVRVVTDSCAPTQVVVRLPGSVLGAAGTGQIQVTNPDGLSSTSMPVSLTLPVFPFLSFAAPLSVPSGQDRPVTLILNGAYPVALQGTLTMTFTPDGNLPDDPAIQFQNGSRVFAFTIPAGTQPQIQVAIKSGTVAGLITITPAFNTGSPDATPQDGVAQRIQIARAAPWISLLTCTRTASGFVAVVEGFTNTREATQASFDLQSGSGDSLGTAQLGADAPVLFSGWFGSDQAATSGGLFRYSQTFTPQFDASKIASATVKVSNTIGTSTTASCQLQ